MPSLLRRESLVLSSEVLDQTLEGLAAFLRTELFAVQTYSAALQRVSHPTLRTELTRLRNSHAGRACLLRERISEFGGAPANDTEPWGAFANAFRRVISALDDADTIAALCEGEEWELRDYEADLDEIDGPLRDELAIIVLSEQRRTWERVRSLTPEGCER